MMLVTVTATVMTRLSMFIEDIVCQELVRRTYEHRVLSSFFVTSHLQPHLGVRLTRRNVESIDTGFLNFLWLSPW
jgi:hypothetical protein